jgi:hypothetical protein
MPYKWFEGIQASTGKFLSGWNWKPSGKYRDEKDQLSRLFDEWVKETDAFYKEHGYYTTTKSWPQIEDWLDDTIDEYRYSGAGWWERNWFPVVMVSMIGGGMLLIGFVNGWS